MPRRSRVSADVCVIGAGPAGSVLAARLAQLGHDVVLVERAAFPRRHLGESLSPGVFPLLETLGMHEMLECAATKRVHSVSVAWSRGAERRDDPSGSGRLVDRGPFDALLLAFARAAGVRVLQPATVLAPVSGHAGWTLSVATPDEHVELHCRFIADATGRASFLTANRRRAGRRTLALYAYGRGAAVPGQPHIEAVDDAWLWAVPLPDGSCNVLAFVDTAGLHASRLSPAQMFAGAIERSSTLSGMTNLRLEGPVRGADATPYVDRAAVTPKSIKVGDAALALDPLSSSGVQKAIQTSLAGAIVVNTLLRRPSLANAALEFYRNLLTSTSRRHARWAGSYYGEGAEVRKTPFWITRAGGGHTVGRSDGQKLNRHALASTVDRPLRLSRRAEFVDTPVLEGDFVAVKRAVRHPELETPVAYVGGLGIGDLADALRPGMTAEDAARAWSARMPMKSGLGVASWMVRHGILVPAKRPPAVRLSAD